MPDPARPRGASLIETCLALAVIAAALAAAAPPILRAQRSYRLAATAGQVRAELHRARVLAVTRNQDCRLRVTSNTAYRIECEEAGWIPIASHRLPAGLTITANNRPEFHPLGNAAPAATITVSNRDGMSRRVIVSRSGRVRTE